jgi:hypothetical protein
MDGRLNLMALTDAAKQQLSEYCAPYIRFSKIPSHYTFTLKMAIRMFVKTSDNSKHWMQPRERIYKYRTAVNFIYLPMVYLNTNPAVQIIWCRMIA